MMSTTAAEVERLVPLPFDLVREELAEIDALLLREGWSEVSMVREISHHILGAGGKRLRPALVLTAARAVGHRSEWAIRLAVCMELLHTATLMHDDVVDHADWRRGRITAHRRWGQSASILTGDVLFAKAMRILVDYGDLAVLDAVTSAIIEVCEGEVLELAINGDPDAAIGTYLQVIEAKTAALLSACCRTGGMLGGAPPEIVSALGAFGHHLGMAFQIMDDLLDLTADADRWGKPIGKDLCEGRITLPFLYTLRRASPADRERLRTLLASPEIASAQVEEALILAERYDGLRSTRHDAEQQVQSAKACLVALSPSVGRDALEAIAEYSLSRDH